MGINEIISGNTLDKACVIQFPVMGNSYKEYKNVVSNKLPFSNELYHGSVQNRHHYTTKYHIDFVLPELDRLLNFGYNRKDFIIKDNCQTTNGKHYDFSYLCPKNEPKIKCISFEYGLSKYDFYSKMINCNDFINKMVSEPTKYHQLYVFSHSCSKIINENSKTNRILLISGDSQMIPDILPLSYYFREVYYMDNRTFEYGNLVSFKKYLEGVDFTDFLVGLYDKPLKRYLEYNIK